MKLYYSPGSCSLGTHIVLEEAGVRFDTQRLDLRAGDNLKPEFLKVNEKARVPALELDDGQILTENLAIIHFVADAHPGLLPTPGTLERARANEHLSWCATSIHAGAFGPWFHPERYVDGVEAQAGVREKVKAMVAAELARIDRKLQNRDFVLGTFTAADAYTIVFYRWAKAMSVPLGENLKRSVRALLQRAGVQRAIMTQQIKVEV
jgi:glutathione S-transferase